MSEDLEILQEFLVESHENLARLDLELVELEKQPKNTALLASVFRTFHTIKGTCGFLGFGKLERVAHQAENLLSQLRDRQRELEPELISIILETVDAIRQVLSSIEKTGSEGAEDFESLTSRLRAEAQVTTTRMQAAEAAKAAVPPAETAVATPSLTAAAVEPPAAVVSAATSQTAAAPKTACVYLRACFRLRLILN